MNREPDDDLRETEALVARTQERASGALDARIVRGIDLAEGIAGAVLEFEGRPAPRREWRRAAAVAAGGVAIVGIAVFVVSQRLADSTSAQHRIEAGAARQPPADPDPPSPPAPIDPEVAGSPPSPPRGDGRSLPSRSRPGETHDPGDAGHDERSDPRTALQAADSGTPQARYFRPAGTSSTESAASLDLFETVAAAKLIARLTVVGEPGPSGGTIFRDGSSGRVAAEITAVYKGDVALVSARVELLPGRGESRRSFLACDADAPAEFWRPGTSFLACLEETAARSADAGRTVRVALGEGYAVTLVSGHLPDPITTADAGRLLRALDHDLSASLADRRAAVRASAITALRRIEDSGDRSLFASPVAPRLLWRDPLVAAALLAAARDPDPRVRWNLAWMDPSACGSGGVAILQQLLFDSVPLVRAPAARRLADIGRRELADPYLALHDADFAERHSRDVLAASVRLRDRPAVERALRVIDDRSDGADRMQYMEALASVVEFESGDLLFRVVGALSRALSDDDADTRRAAADSLGKLGDPTIVGLLPSRDEREDPRVRVAAAAAQVRLGDLTGLAALRSLTRGRDARAAAQAVHVVGELAVDVAPIRRDLVSILFDAYGAEDPAVRGEVLATLASLANELEPDERGRLDALLAEAASDGALYVVVAAQVAPALIARALAAGELESNRLRELGYGAGEVIDRIGYGK